MHRVFTLNPGYFTFFAAPQAPHRFLPRNVVRSLLNVPIHNLPTHPHSLRASKFWPNFQSREKSSTHTYRRYCTYLYHLARISHLKKTVFQVCKFAYISCALNILSDTYYFHISFHFLSNKKTTILTMWNQNIDNINWL